MLLDTIQKHMIDAMKAKDELRLSTLRSIKTALDRFRTDQTKPLDDKAEQQILGTLSKQRKESHEMFTNGNRPELALKEYLELKIIEEYQHKEATVEEIDNAIQETLNETGATTQKQMGLVMKSVMGKLAGKRVDGKVLSEKIKNKLQ